MSELELFNNTLINLAIQLAEICPKSIISIYLNLIKKVVLNNPDKIIIEFIIHVLPHKDKIDAGNEDFFMNKSYEKEAKGDDEVIDKIFKFKDIWKQLNTTNKNIVIQYMICLCYYAQLYLLKH
jgi:hypothetical protein